MAVTARDIIRGALRLNGALASGEAVPAAEALDGLETLNALMQSWSLESLIIWHLPRVLVPLEPGKAVYTWGPGGEILSHRPLRLETALLEETGLGGQSAYEWPISVWSHEEYTRGIAMKELPSTYVQGVYLEPAIPLARLHVWPLPTTSTTALILYPWLPLNALPTLDDPWSFPTGYDRMLRVGLAIELSAEYGREVTPLLVAMLAEAKAAVKRQNTVIPTLGLDHAFSGRQAGDWDAMTGGYLWRR